MGIQETQIQSDLHVNYKNNHISQNSLTISQNPPSQLFFAMSEYFSSIIQTLVPGQQVNAEQKEEEENNINREMPANQHPNTTSTPQDPTLTPGNNNTSSRPGPARTDSIADHIITTGISRTKEVNQAWKTRNDENIENKKNSWKTITSFIGTVACCCLVLGLILDILKIHTSRFWISLPVRIALFSILAFFEFPSLYIEIVGLMGKNSVPETVELGAKSYLTNGQTRGIVYIILSLMLMGIMYQFQINFALPIVVGVLHVYTFRTLGGEEPEVETPEPEQV